VKPWRASATFADERQPAARRRLLSALVSLALCGWAGHVVAAVTGADAGAPAVDAMDAMDASFDRSLLSGAGQNTTDLARFERGDFIPAGSYSVDLFLNGGAAGRTDVRFAAASADASATPCVTRRCSTGWGCTRTNCRRALPPTWPTTASASTSPA
jgi:outer membrane usher protein